MAKYSTEIAMRLLELAMLGYTDSDACRLLGVSRMTLHRWYKKHPKLKEKVREAEKDFMRSKMRIGLGKLVEGYESREVKTESVKLDDDGNPIKVIETVRHVAPSERAIEIAARKYDIALSREGAEHRHNATNLTLNVGFNASDMTQRELQQLTVSSPLGSVIDAEYKEVECLATDIPRGEASSAERTLSDPPGSDEELE